VVGEASITETGGHIERVHLTPPTARAYPRSVQRLLAADMIVIGPGSLYTSILPSLLINGIAEAVRASQATTVYVCNVAMQPGETDGYTVADHILALEQHIGQGLFDVVIANNRFDQPNAGQTRYVQPVPDHHALTERYDLIYADLTDSQYPWRHDPVKLADVLRQCLANYQATALQDNP
jgi:uncharacterized cofD-like protein